MSYQLRQAERRVKVFTAKASLPTLQGKLFCKESMFLEWVKRPQTPQTSLPRK